MNKLKCDNSVMIHSFCFDCVHEYKMNGIVLVNRSINRYYKTHIDVKLIIYTILYTAAREMTFRNKIISWYVHITSVPADQEFPQCGCPFLDGQHGTLLSPGYPQSLQTLHCLWRIEVELYRVGCARLHRPDSKFYGANMGPTWGRQDPGGPHVGPMNLVIWGYVAVIIFISDETVGRPISVTTHRVPDIKIMLMILLTHSKF